jgi:hypothetical protein
MYRSDASDYGSSKPSSWLPRDTWLYLHCFINWLGRETGYGPADRSAGVLWIVSGSLFLRSSGPAQLCWRLCKKLPCTWTVRRKRTRGICELTQEAYVSCRSREPSAVGRKWATKPWAAPLLCSWATKGFDPCCRCFFLFLISSNCYKIQNFVHI